MGITASSRFRNALSRGDERGALEIWRHSGPDFWDSVKPNEPYGSSYDDFTPFLYASKYGMENFVSRFMNRGADVTVANARGETAMHLLCTYTSGEGSSPGRIRVRSRAKEDRIRQKLVEYVFEWKRQPCCQSEPGNPISLDALDKQGESALHKAAKSGLKECVEVLLSHGASLFIENKIGQTPCDCAEQAGLTDIAEFLESKMVFSEVPETENGNDGSTTAFYEQKEEDSGLRTQDVQEVKDKLLVETSDMLGVPLFTAEALLRNHGWDKESLVDAWMEDAAATCERAGVHPPSEVVELGKETELHGTGCEVLKSGSKGGSKNSRVTKCTICEIDVLPSEPCVPIPCGHSFCRQCWESYLNIKIQDGDAHNILCPGQDCAMLVPVETIERLVSKEMARRYLQFDIKAFVESNPNLKWCPYPGCGRVVRRPSSSSRAVLLGAAAFIPEQVDDGDLCKAVDCGNGHYFCWGCGGDAHEPCQCEQWKKWLEKITEMKAKTSVSDAVAYSAAANLWLVKNAKQCPNNKCKSPIQKNEGCNHMKCLKCKHEFCWVCLEEWKKHSSATGGYFKCNRYDAIKRVEEVGKSVISEVSGEYVKVREVHRFRHFFERFENHGTSCLIEEQLLSGLEEKFQRLSARTDSGTADTAKFMEDAVREVLKARQILRGSYALGYYMDLEVDRSLKDKVVVFEFLQNELEIATEQLSQMVNRLHLKTPRGRIISATRFLRRKRHEFLSSAEKDFIPPDHAGPWSRNSDREDIEFSRAVEASLRDKPLSPTASTPARRFPRYHDMFVDSDDDNEESEEHVGGNEDSSESENPLIHLRNLMAMIEALSDDIHRGIGRKCIRDGCSNRAVIGPSVTHNGFCSERCALIDRERWRTQAQRRQSTDQRDDRSGGRQQQEGQVFPRPRVRMRPRRSVASASQPSEVTAAGQLDARRPDRSLPQPSRRNRRRHPPSGVTARETSSASVATPDVEAVPSPRLTGRVSTAGDSSPDEGLRRALALSRQTTDRVSAAPTKETTSVDGELELALAMSRQSAARDSLVAGSTDQTASSQIQEMPVAAPGHSAPDQDEDLELALRLSIFGSCVEGIHINDGDLTEDTDLQRAIQLSLAENTAGSSHRAEASCESSAIGSRDAVTARYDTSV